MAGRDRDRGRDRNEERNRGRKQRTTTGDLSFNKLGFPSFAVDPNGLLPLKRIDYPITGFVNRTLRVSDAYSVITPDDFEVVYNIVHLIDSVGGLPPMPEPDVDAPFWKLLRHVMRVREIRLATPNRKLFPRPERWLNNNLNEVAEFVHNEFPGSIQALLLSDILQKKHGPVVVDPNIIPRRTDFLFLQKDFLLAHINTWTMSVVGPHNFCAKWYCGRPRPEEVVWAIKQGEITEGVPPDIAARIRELDINSAPEFTAYAEGSPRHPSWPAMHAAATSLSLWMSVVLDANDEQLCQAILTDYGISYARTVAGVHYPDDNIAGLNMAQQVLRRAMPQYLKEKYNSDPEQVALKIKNNLYDWRDFDPANPCPFLQNSETTF